jgi:DNA-binding beta-propeller fold protein YncE
VHSVKVSRDGLVYVADRGSRRIQVFDLQGTYLTQTFVNRAGPSSNSVAGLAFSPDEAQRFLYVVDYGNSHVAVLERGTLRELYQFGGLSDRPGDFRGPHHIAANSRGDLYVAEVVPGNRVQKLSFTGMSPTPPANALPMEPATASTAGQ